MAIPSHQKIATSYMGAEIKFDLYRGSFSDIDKTKVKQVYGIILNNLGEILLVFQKTEVFLLPGGQIEIGESYVDTLNREVYEEAAVCLDQASIHEAFYQEAYFYKNNELQFDSIQLRYVARASKIDQFVMDGDQQKEGSIVGNKWVKQNELDNYLKWGETNEIIKSFMN